MDKDEFAIDLPLGRHLTQPHKQAVRDDGKESLTLVKVLERLNGATLVELTLITGRTHQIRVHMASINHPLLGDEIYGPKNKPFKTEGQVLHAGILGFEHPIKGEYMEFKAELPEYFGKILDRLRK